MNHFELIFACEMRQRLRFTSTVVEKTNFSPVKLLGKLCKGSVTDFWCLVQDVRNLGVYYSILTVMWKAEQTDTLTVLLRSIREGRQQGKFLPPKLERQTDTYRESPLTGAGTQEQKPLGNQFQGEDNLNCAWQVTGGSVWVSPSVK